MVDGCSWDGLLVSSEDAGCLTGWPLTEVRLFSAPSLEIFNIGPAKETRMTFGSESHEFCPFTCSTASVRGHSAHIVQPDFQTIERRGGAPVHLLQSFVRVYNVACAQYSPELFHLACARDESHNLRNLIVLLLCQQSFE